MSCVLHSSLYYSLTDQEDLARHGVYLAAPCTCDPCFVNQVLSFFSPGIFPLLHVGRMNGVRHQDMDSSDSDAVYINHSGQVNGGGGRGRGRGGRSYRSSRYDKGPQIDTWTNETAENAEKENSTWEMSEDWTTDEWTGSVSGLSLAPCHYR